MGEIVFLVGFLYSNFMPDRASGVLPGETTSADPCGSALVLSGSVM
jgi:hypothetical protein